MRKTVAGLFIILTMFTAGCLDTTQEEDFEPNITQPIDYREQDPDPDINEGRETVPDLDNVNDRLFNENNLNATSYGDEDLAALAEIIRSRVETVPGVNGAQTVVTNDKIMVALDIQNYKTDTDTASIVRQVVEDMTARDDIKPKEVVVYTDQIYFDRLQNLRDRQGTNGLFND
ncbi:MAG: YhcN/YlaJ family sporulation lipoprotein [Bacillaceae bacterium]|nr:YhcN/YlaJ family sporulation lipoprotein [Bacillaceae bacterium]